MTSSPGAEDDRDERPKPKSDFSIEHILNRAGERSNRNFRDSHTQDVYQLSIVPFPWIHCTRYCPPKIQRTNKKEGPQRRQLGRHPRIPFTSHQLQALEEKYRQSPYLSSSEVTKISTSLQLADVRVKIWFQNRRARERREKITNESDESKIGVKSLENVCETEKSLSSESTKEETSFFSSCDSKMYANFAFPQVNVVESTARCNLQNVNIKP